MEKVYARAGGWKETQVRRIALDQAGLITKLWCCKNALKNAITLAHPDPGKRLCVFTDASEEHWGSAITQVPIHQLRRDFEDQHHEPLMMLRDTFSDGATGWAIRHARLLRRASAQTISFIIRMDLVFIGITGIYATFSDHQRYRRLYRTAIRLVSLPISQLDDSFGSPTLVHIRTVQAKAGAPSRIIGGSDHVYRNVNGKIRLPDEAAELQLRICLVGHFGAAGKRTMEVTLQAVADKFVWADLKDDVKRFVNRCLHCARVKRRIGIRPKY
ncbi:LOW QUALITY PROTEIN: hypothetical protein PHMEG_00020539, partial [Phytophthora megakarya]